MLSDPQTPLLDDRESPMEYYVAFTIPSGRSERARSTAGRSTALVEGTGMTDQRILSRRDVACLLDVSLSTLWRLVRNGSFPPPMRVSPGRVGWRAKTVERWIDAREAASGGSGAGREKDAQ